jgi:cytochrome P450
VSETRPVVDFDHHTLEYQEEGRRLYRELRASCPVAWSEHYGGFWVLSPYEAVWNALRDHETFSSAKHQDEDGNWHGGDVIPNSGRPPLIPLEVDPPTWNPYRRLLNPLLSPARVDERRAAFEAYATDLIDGFIEKGTCDLVLDFGNPLPAMATLDMVGIPLDDWHRWADVHHAVQYAEPGSPEYTRAVDGFAWQFEQLVAGIVERRANPRDDMLTTLAQGELDGAPLDPTIGAGVLLTVIGGGVDTTTSLFANAMIHLSRHPEHRAWLLEDLGGRLPLAAEEFLRVYPPVPAVARSVNGDVEFGGQTMCPGEVVLVPVLSANFDPAQFEEPEEVRLDREVNRHVTFGLGIHRCVGSSVARTVIQIMLEQVLRRMPDVSVDEARARRYGPTSAVDGWISLPATFTPGARTQEKNQQ